MAYKSDDITELFSVLGIAFIVGVIAQYLRQKTDETVSNTNIWWLSLASGFSAMIPVGLLYEYTDISGAFLVSISGLAGWTGISILSTLSKSFDQLLIKGAEKRFGINMDEHTPVNTTKLEEVTQDDATITRIGSQSE